MSSRTRWTTLIGVIAIGPIGRGGRTTDLLPPAPIHAWLDGELPESAVRTAEFARDVDFWRKVTEETERRRATKTPAYLEAQIMAALPTETTADGVQTWWAREVTMTPTTAAVAAASLLAVGAAATVAVLRAIR